MNMINLQSFSSIVFDLDGVIYRGDTIRKGASELLALLDARGIKYHFLTNTSSQPRKDIILKLLNLGVKINRDHDLVSTCSEIAAHYLLEQFGQHSTVLTIGGGLGVADELKRVGIKQIALESCSLDEVTSVYKSRNDLLLLLGWTKEFSYETATTVLQLSRNIAQVFATDNDRYFSSDTGNLPGTAWLNGSIGSLLDVEIISLGKPNPASLSLALRKMHSTPSSTLLIGDSLISDIQVGKALGCNTVLVLGGASTLSDIQVMNSKMKPDYIINELSDLVEILLIT